MFKISQIIKIACYCFALHTANTYNILDNAGGI